MLSWREFATVVTPSTWLMPLLLRATPRLDLAGWSGAIAGRTSSRCLLSSAGALLRLVKRPHFHTGQKSTVRGSPAFDAEPPVCSRPTARRAEHSDQALRRARCHPTLCGHRGVVTSVVYRSSPPGRSGVGPSSPPHSGGEIASVTRVSSSATFDFEAFMSVVDSERRERGMGWYDLANLLWEQSADLNAHLGDHPL